MDRGVALPFGRAAAALCACLGTGCSGASPLPPSPVVDAEQVASVVRRSTRLERPTLIIFEWRLTEREGRFDGRGVARLEPPDRVRLDLFLGNGETLTTAALVGGDLRIPPGAQTNLIPPPHLLWGTLGVFEPGTGAALLGGSVVEDADLLLRYGFASGEELRYTLRGPLIRQVELVRDGDVVQRVAVEQEADERFPSVAVFRDMGEFVELTITRESIDYVEPYPPDIWNPGR